MSEILGDEQRTYPRRCVRELCRGWIASWMDVTGNDNECPICHWQGSRGDIITRHWHCVETEFLCSDPDKPEDELMDEDYDHKHPEENHV